MAAATIESKSGIETLIDQAKLEIAATQRQTSTGYEAVVRDLRARYLEQLSKNVYEIWADLPQLRTTNRPYRILLKGLADLLRDQEQLLQQNLTDQVFKTLRQQGLDRKQVTQQANAELTVLKKQSLATICAWAPKPESDNDSESSDDGDFENSPLKTPKKLFHDLDQVRFLYFQYRLELALIHKSSLIKQLNEILTAPLLPSMPTDASKTPPQRSRKPKKPFIKSLVQRYYRARMTAAPVVEYQPTDPVVYERKPQQNTEPTHLLIKKIHKLNSLIYQLEERLSSQIVQTIYRKLGLLAEISSTHAQMTTVTGTRSALETAKPPEKVQTKSNTAAPPSQQPNNDNPSAHFNPNCLIKP